nr:MAG TPA: hypothetical protein [Caudoviricetes sp.]
MFLCAWCFKISYNCNGKSTNGMMIRGSPL